MLHWRQPLELLYLLVKRDLKVRYKSRFLGYLWALANPLAFAFIYWIAFKFIMRLQMENYSLFLICGLFPWVWLNSGVVNGTRSFVNNAALIKKANLPRAVLPLASVAQEMVHFLFALPVIFVFLVFAGELGPHTSWLWQIPVLLALQLAFTYPLALSFALADVYVRDIEYLIGIAFMLLFFATPMVYPVTMVPESYRLYFELNPVHALMDSWRSVLMQGSVETGKLEYMTVAAAVSGAVAWLLYRRLAPRIGEIL